MEVEMAAQDAELAEVIELLAGLDGEISFPAATIEAIEEVCAPQPQPLFIKPNY
jgi:hypothetical protein